MIIHLLQEYSFTIFQCCNLLLQSPNECFIGYSRYKGENWMISVISEATGELFDQELRRFKDYESIINRLLLTRVVPPVTSTLPLVREARAALGERLDPFSLEGYVVGRLALRLLENTSGELTPEAVLAAAKGARFDIGGLEIDLRDDRQGSDLVSISVLSISGERPMEPELWAQWSQ